MESTAQKDLFDLQDRPGKGGRDALDGNPRVSGKAGKPSPDEFDYWQGRRASTAQNVRRIEKLSQPFIGPVAGNGVRAAQADNASAEEPRKAAGMAHQSEKLNRPSIGPAAGSGTPNNASEPRDRLPLSNPACDAPICNLASTCPDAGRGVPGGGEDAARDYADRVGGGPRSAMRMGVGEGHGLCGLLHVEVGADELGGGYRVDRIPEGAVLIQSCGYLMSQQRNAGVRNEPSSKSPSPSEIIALANTASRFGYRSNDRRCDGAPVIFARTAGHKEISVSALLTTCARGFHRDCPHGVTQRFQTTVHEGDPLSRARNLFSKDRCRLSLFDETTPHRPEMAVVFEAAAATGRGKRLAGTRSRPERAIVRPSSKSSCIGPAADASKEVALCIALEVVWMDIHDAPLVNVAWSDMPGSDQVAEPLRRIRVDLVEISASPRLYVSRSRAFGLADIAATAFVALDRQTVWAMCWVGGHGLGLLALLDGGEVGSQALYGGLADRAEAGCANRIIFGVSLIFHEPDGRVNSAKIFEVANPADRIDLALNQTLWDIPRIVVADRDDPAILNAHDALSDMEAHARTRWPTIPNTIRTAMYAENRPSRTFAITKLAAMPAMETASRSQPSCSAVMTFSRCEIAKGGGDAEKAPAYDGGDHCKAKKGQEGVGGHAALAFFAAAFSRAFAAASCRAMNVASC